MQPQLKTYTHEFFLFSAYLSERERDAHMYMVQFLPCGSEADSVECFSFGSWLAGEAKGLTSCLVYMHVVMMCGSPLQKLDRSFYGVSDCTPTIEEPFQFHF